MRTALRIARLSRKLTQEDVAKALGISRSMYSMIEIGLRNPTLAIAQKLALFFATDIETLFFDSHCHETRLA